MAPDSWNSFVGGKDTTQVAKEMSNTANVGFLGKDAALSRAKQMLARLNS